MIRIERQGNRILLDSETPTPGIKTSIPGAYFRQDGIWSVPLDLTTCHLLRERFGKRLLIGPDLTAWARAEKAQRKSLQSTAAALNAELHRLPTVAPLLHAAMESRTYQRSAARYVADALGRDGRRRALIADTVGLGKTTEALAAVLESDVPGPYLIVCPKTSVESTWAAEIRKRLPDDQIVTLPEGKAKRDSILWNLAYGPNVYEGQDFRESERFLKEHEESLARTWVIVHPAVVRTQTWFVCNIASCGMKTKYKVGPVPELDCGHEKDRRTLIDHEHQFPQLFMLDYGAVIADESDQMLIRLTGTPNLQRRGMEMLRDLVRDGGCRIAMSGTPFRSKPHQIWSTLNWLDPTRWSGKWRWIQQYWQTGGYSGYEISPDGFMKDREHLLLAELSDVMIRRTREEVRGDLPEKLYPSNVSEDSGLTPGIYLEMNARQRKAYDGIVRMAEADLEGGKLGAIGILAEITRMKQFAGAEGRLNVYGEFEPLAAGNKFEWILEFLRSMGLPDRPDGKIVIASQFTKLLNAFAAGVDKEFRGKLRHDFITGDVSGARRPEVIAEFEDVDSDLYVLFVNTKAGGSAITLDAADSMVILDETYVDDEQQQLEGRIDNRNPERKIVPRSYYYLRSLNSVEEGIAAGNAAAKARGARILDGASIAKQAKGLIK